MTDVINPSTVESPETYLQYGDRYRNSGNEPLALKNYRRALEINPNFTTALVRIGGIHQQQGNTMEAIANFNKAVEIDPQSLEAQLGLGNAYQQMGWAELAITHFQKALEFHPDRFLAEYHCKLGDSLKIGVKLLMRSQAMKERSPQILIMSRAIERSRKYTCARMISMP